MPALQRGAFFCLAVSRRRRSSKDGEMGRRFLDMNQTEERGGIRDAGQYGLLSFNGTNWPTPAIRQTIYETDGFESAYFIERQLLSSFHLLALLFRFRQKYNRGAERDLFFPQVQRCPCRPLPQLPSPILP